MGDQPSLAVITKLPVETILNVCHYLFFIEDIKSYHRPQERSKGLFEVKFNLVFFESLCSFNVRSKKITVPFPNGQDPLQGENHIICC
ncbi:hypothetical protein ES708_34017 [subsurface metagenome]